jgi:type II restriction/modification system DNA methylase subunit YeeA
MRPRTTRTGEKPLGVAGGTRFTRAMDAKTFIDKWRHAELKERSASQSHFNDLCALLGVVDPITADPKGEWFTFEKGASKTSGGEGWADVWRKGSFAWEYKGKRKDLKAAFNQLLQYSVALENPPLLIVSDMDRILIHTNWTNTVQEVHEFATEDLLDGAVRDRLKAAFTDPKQFRPKMTRQALTEETASEFASLAQRLRERGHEAHQVAHFINRLVFCMFAEDVGLLPDHMFTKMLRASQIRPERFETNARKLFAAMAEGGDIDFTPIEWFNGGLFDSDHALPVTSEDIGQLIQAAERHWDQIDPSILGTLFERGLDPAKRSQLGAHYTDRDKIMMIVKPVIIDPLEAEWEDALANMTALIEKAPRETKDKLLRGAELAKRTKALNDAEAIHNAFIERLAAFRVLDPACGSGNFLYVALKALKDIEHRANLDAEALGLPRGFPRVGPESVLGIELNPYAAELARVSVWIGEIQWMRRNGFAAARNPILRSLDTIECRDALLVEETGERAEWPDADVVIGNPPFLGSKYLRKGRPATKNKPALEGLGDRYVDALFAAYRGKVPASADLVSYWFFKAHQAIKNHGLLSFGLIATKSIGKGASNKPLAALLSDTDYRIFSAWQNEPWVVDGADVRVAVVCAMRNPSEFSLNGSSSGPINADLTDGLDTSKARTLSANRRRAFQGVKLNGPFEISAAEARTMLSAPSNPNGLRNSRVIRRFVGNDDVTMRDRDAWVIDFTDFPALQDAALFEQPFAHVEKNVVAHRDSLAVAKTTETERLSNYWLMQRPRPKLRAASVKYDRVIAVPETSEHLLFRFLPREAVFSGSVFVIAADDTTMLGLLSSRFHHAWARAQGNRLGAGNQSRYNATRTFETFPFPEGLTPDIPATDYADDPRAQKIGEAAARLNQLRENWLNPADLIVHEPEVVPGYPDRILPKDEAAAKELKKRTLTNLYNARPQWLANAHAALDEAVAEAYGWGDDWRGGLLTDDEILARLLTLNQERATAQQASGSGK